MPQVFKKIVLIKHKWLYMNEFLLIALWAGIVLHWLFIHFRFKRVLKKNDPSLYQAHSQKSFLKYTSGRAWIDLALDGGHQNSSCDRVVKYGNRLKSSYDNLLGRVVMFFILLALIIAWGRIAPLFAG